MNNETLKDKPLVPDKSITEGSILGAAGCKWIKENRYCGRIIKKDSSFYCKDYGDLDTHFNGEAVRHNRCSESV